MSRSTFNYRFVIKTLGFLLIIESIFMMLASIVSFYKHEASGDYLLISCTITFFSGIFLRLLGTDYRERPIGKRESFLVVALAWVVLSAFGMLPFYFSGEIPNVSDAYFETMSGFTTTGATIIIDIESMSYGLLFWRSLTQWIGAIGIIVFALSILPMLGGNASVLFDAETTGIGRDRLRPRVTEVAKRIWIVYIILTGALIFLLWAGPMNLFDSVCHALSTVSTGGYSTKNASIGHWNSPYLEYVISIFMWIGGINFALLFLVLKGMSKIILKDEEFRWYIYITLIFIIIIASGFYFSNKYPDVEESLRTSLFHVTSIITTTGYVTKDYVSWGAFYSFLFYIMMFVCACAGSTSGGIKIARLIVLCKNAINEFKRQVHPNAILPVRLNRTIVPMDHVTKVLAFMFLYLVILVVGFLFLSLSGMEFEESYSTALSCLGNSGVGFGIHGQSGHFADVPTVSKWFLTFMMLTGRLELFTILSLFIPAFWKR